MYGAQDRDVQLERKFLGEARRFRKAVRLANLGLIVYFEEYVLRYYSSSSELACLLEVSLFLHLFLSGATMIWQNILDAADQSADRLN